MTAFYHVDACNASVPPLPLPPTPVVNKQTDNEYKEEKSHADPMIRDGLEDRIQEDRYDPEEEPKSAMRMNPTSMIPTQPKSTMRMNWHWR